MSDTLTVKLTNGLSVDSSTHKKFLNHWYIDVSVIVLSFVLIFLSYVAIKPLLQHSRRSEWCGG
jgi:hypothetical protein